MKKERWIPLLRATSLVASPEVAVERARTAPEELAAYDRHTTYWVNDLYQVSRTELDNGGVHLYIRRRDGRPIFRDWRHFQRIKNELVGLECEAVELYPAESRLVDSTNKYHLFGSPNPTFRFSFGYTERDVADGSGTEAPSLRQRRLG